VDGRLEFFPGGEAAFPLGDGGLDPFPRCSPTPAVCIMDFSAFILESVCFAVEL